MSSGDVVIDAPVRAVFALRADVVAWPSWRADVGFVERLDPGALHVGSQFRWETGGIAVTSTVAKLRSQRCILWGGPADGVTDIHLWTFRHSPRGTLGHTEELWSGAQVEAVVPAAQTALDGSLATWRADLKGTAARAEVHAPSRAG